MKKNKVKLLVCFMFLSVLFLPTWIFPEEKNADGPDNLFEDINDLDIKSDLIKIDLKNSITSFIGDVKITADNMEMNCQRLTVYSKKSQKDVSENNKQPPIDKFHATGKIKITIPEMGNATSEEAVYESDSKQIVLTGNPVGKFLMDDQIVEIPGGVDKITYDLKEKAIFVESSENEQAELSISGKDKKVIELSSPVEKLEARVLAKIYKRKRVVDKVNISIGRNSIVGLLGPNGAGKTTTFYMMIGLIRPDEGDILLDGDIITDEPMYLRARMGVSYLPQEPSVLRKLTVEENLLVVMEGLFPASEINYKLENFLTELDLTDLAGQKASSLSGGERRRLEITRALVTGPRFILLDEPFAGIDPLILSDIKLIVKKLKEKGIGIIISDHNVRDTLDVCDAAYIIESGNIVEYGTPEEILNSEVARSVYLGEDFNM